MTSLAPVIPKLCPLIRMLGSANDGEALAAARAIGRTLKSAGGDFHDLASALERSSAHEPHRADDAGCPIWFALPRISKIRWMQLIADQAEPGTWTEDFALNVLTVLQANRRLSAKQANCAGDLVAMAWRKGARI